MVKKRKIELLREMKETIINNVCGLCSANLLMYHSNTSKNKFEEYYFILGLIDTCKPKKMYDDRYYWNPSDTKPRINWINKRIKEIENG